MRIAGSFPEGRFSNVPAPFYRVIEPPYTPRCPARSCT